VNPVVAVTLGLATGENVSLLAVVAMSLVLLGVVMGLTPARSRAVA
jgi:hypothetical protein